MDLVPYSFNPEYWVEEITSRLQLIAKTTAQPSFSVWLQSFVRTLTAHIKYCFGFLPKNICVKNELMLFGIDAR